MKELVVNLCSIEGCEKPSFCRGWCRMHHERWRVHGELGGPLPVKLPRGSVCSSAYGYKTLLVNGKRIFEHIIKAETALGRKLPIGAEVHHADRDRANNENTNLVICPDRAYHQLLHLRLRAIAACGNPSYRKCKFCKQHDTTENLSKERHSFFHVECRKDYRRGKANEKNGYQV